MTYIGLFIMKLVINELRRSPYRTAIYKEVDTECQSVYRHIPLDTSYFFSYSIIRSIYWEID